MFSGQMIKAFSSFVVGTKGTEGLIVGFVIFIAIIAVQAVVITKGAGRIAEVAARFTLDKMPAKQMAVESEFNSGAITEAEMRKRKEEIEQESEFFGAMDGASKFVAGNVKFGIFMTVVNILAGIIIGAALRGETVINAMGIYVSFAIGDGILSQFPAFLVSTATGIIVTRSAASGTFAEDIAKEFTQQPRIYWIGGALLLIMALIPGFPWYVLIPLAILMGFFGYKLGREQARAKAAAEESESGKSKEDSQTMSPLPLLDPLLLELGFALIPLVDKDKGAELMERVKMLRRQTAQDLGLVIQQIRIVDNMLLDPVEYCFKINGVEFGRGKIRMGCYLGINATGSKSDIPGEHTVDPAFGMPAVWIDEEYRDEAERAGFTIVDPPSVITTHLTEIIRHNAGEILRRQETQEILDELKKLYPAVVEDALKALSLGEIQKVLQGLLREQVSIRNLVPILEACSDYAAIAKKIYGDYPVSFLVEKARQALGRQICLQYADDEHNLHCLTLGSDIEQKLMDSSYQSPTGPKSGMEPALRAQWIKGLERSVSVMKEHGWFPPVVLARTEASRPIIKQSAESQLPDLVVLSYDELVQDVNIIPVGEVQTAA
jgi:flagellar biosynthesis protein FlhA